LSDACKSVRFLCHASAKSTAMFIPNALRLAAP
jgi:hypothetical protein